MSSVSYTDEIGSDGKATGNQIPHAGVPISYSVSPDHAIDGAFTVDFAGMTPGNSYKITVTPFSYVDKTNTNSPGIYGNHTVSNVAFVPVPQIPVLNVTSNIGKVTKDEQAGNLLYVNGNFNLGMLSTFLNQTDGTNASIDCKFTVLQSDGTINSVNNTRSTDYENNISVPVSVSDTNRSSIIQIVAENQNGEKSIYSLVVHYNNNAPALFVNADSNGTIFTEQNGNYLIQGSTQPFITVMDSLGNQATADQRGNFTINGTLSAGLQAYSTITAMDSFGNSTQDDVVISRTTSNYSNSSSSSASSNNSTSKTASQNGATKTDDMTPSSGVVNTTFSDVHIEAPWAEQAIEKAYALGLINGRSADTFDSNSNTKRSEAITLLVRAKKLVLGVPADLNKAASHFADWNSVPEWSKPNIAAAYANGLISGSKVCKNHTIRINYEPQKTLYIKALTNFDQTDTTHFSSFPSWWRGFDSHHPLIMDLLQFCFVVSLKSIFGTIAH